MNNAEVNKAKVSVPAALVGQLQAMAKQASPGLPMPPTTPAPRPTPPGTSPTSVTGVE